MDAMIVRQFSKDIDGLLRDNAMLRKVTRKQGRGIFCLTALSIFLGVEVYLLNKEIASIKDKLDIPDFDENDLDDLDN